MTDGDRVCRRRYPSRKECCHARGLTPTQLRPALEMNRSTTWSNIDMAETATRLGVISFAHGHVNAYIEAIKDFPDAQVVVGWDADRERGATQCAKYALAFEPDLDALLARDDIDAVFVTSPTNQHAAHVVAAAQAGKHVLLQKPMAL